MHAFLKPYKFSIVCHFQKLPCEIYEYAFFRQNRLNILKTQGMRNTFQNILLARKIRNILYKYSISKNNTSNTMPIVLV